MKWVSGDVLKLWLGQETVRDVFLVDFYSIYGEDVQNKRWEKELWNDFLITSSFYGNVGVELKIDAEKYHEELESYLESFYNSSLSKVNMEKGSLVPLSISEMARNLVYAHDIIEDKRMRNPDLSSRDDEDMQVDGPCELNELEYLSCGPFSGCELKHEIRNKETRWQPRRKRVERKIKDIEKHPDATITRGNWGGQFCGGLFVLTVVSALYITYHFNFTNREYILERIFDAVEVSTILTAAVTIFVKIKSSDSSIIRNSVLGIKKFSGFKEVLNHCGIRPEREFSHMVA